MSLDRQMNSNILGYKQYTDFNTQIEILLGLLPGTESNIYVVIIIFGLGNDQQAASDSSCMTRLTQ